MKSLEMFLIYPNISGQPKFCFSLCKVTLQQSIRLIGSHMITRCCSLPKMSWNSETRFKCCNDDEAPSTLELSTTLQLVEINRPSGIWGYSGILGYSRPSKLFLSSELDVFGCNSNIFFYQIKSQLKFTHGK